MDADAITREDYAKSIRYFGTNIAKAIFELKLSYTEEARVFAAISVLPQGYVVRAAE